MNIWDKAKLHEGEIFKTVRGIEYFYVAFNDYILINGDKKRRITKDMFDMSIRITNPTPAKLQKANLGRIHLGIYCLKRHNFPKSCAKFP